MGQLIPSNPQTSVAASRGEKRLTSHHFEMGSLLGRQIAFDLNEEHLATHSCVLGATGSGKSKFLELLMRYLFVARRGFALIDPHGDLSEDLLAYAGYLKASKKDPDIVQRIHYLEPSFERAFSFDPFRFRPSHPIPEDLQRNAYSAWLRAKADRVAEIFQRKQNQPNFEGMPRLQRVLTDVLVATGTNVNGEPSEHLSLSDAMILLDFSDKDRHRKVLDRMRPHLEPEILADFDRLARYNSEEQRLRETESTINRLRSLFSPIVKAIFSQQAESIDFRSIIQNGEILLVNLRETDYFSADQRRALGGLFIHEILTNAQNENRENRKPFHLIIDEAADFIGDDVQMALGVMRKFKLSICLAAQDLSSFKKGDLDLRAKVLSQCGTKVCFNQSWPDDLEILARVLATGNLDFQKHMQVVDRPDGYDWVDVTERSESTGTSQNWATSTSTNSSVTKGTSEGTSRSDTTGQSQAHGKSDSMSESTTTGTTSSRDKTRGRSTSSENSRGNSSRSRSESQSHSSGRNESESHSLGESSGRTSGRSHSSNMTDTVSQSHTEGLTNTVSESLTRGESESTSEGGSKSVGESISFKKVPLARQREEFHEQPALQTAVNDQLEQIKRTIHSLGVGEAVVKLRNEQAAVIIKTGHVKEYWANEKFQAIARMKEICQTKPYFSRPNFTRQASNDRIDQFTSTESTMAPPSAVEEKKGNGHPFVS